MYLQSTTPRYNKSFDLYQLVYNETSELTFSVLAVDGGVPRRGVRLTLSNACQQNALCENIETGLDSDSPTGNVWFRIPKYLVYAFGKYQCGYLGVLFLLTDI